MDVVEICFSVHVLSVELCMRWMLDYSDTVLSPNPYFLPKVLLPHGVQKGAILNSLLMWLNLSSWCCDNPLVIAFCNHPEFREPQFPTSVVLKPVLGTPNHSIFCMSPSFNTPDSTHQFISRVCKTWNGCGLWERHTKCVVAGGPQDRFENHYPT